MLACVCVCCLTGVARRSVKASHVLISADGQVCMSGLRSIFSLIRHGQRARVVHDFPQFSVKVLPWLSPEVLQQVLRPPPPPLQPLPSVGNDGGESQPFLLSEPPGLRFPLGHLQPGDHGLRAGQRPRALQGHAGHPGEDLAARRGTLLRRLDSHLLLLLFQMLLEKLNGTVPCLLDTTTIPPEELALKPSRSGADSGICEGPGVGAVRHSNGDPSSSAHPYNRTFSPHFHAFVELCLQRDPEKR